MSGNIKINIQLFAVLAAVLALIFFTVSNWKDIKVKELKQKAIVECAKVAASAQLGSFNGAVYKFCVEDIGYITKLN